MNFQLIVFYFFSVVLVVSAVRLITARNPVHSALSMVLAFFTMSALWLLLEAEFLAIALVLVYVGAVMVLFLFVIMMLDINLVQMREGFIRFIPGAIIVAMVMITELVLIVLSQHYTPEGHPISQLGVDNTRQLGEVLYTDYLLPFELAAIVLLVAIVAAIVLTLRIRPVTKHQDPGLQVKVRAKDRVRIIKMPSENRG